jgi:hypothetical protein
MPLKVRPLAESVLVQMPAAEAFVVELLELLPLHPDAQSAEPVTTIKQ